MQQDAQEFLGRLFDVLEKQTDQTKFKYLLSSIFGGKSCSQLKCEGGCGIVKNNLEDFYNLSLEVKNHKTLKDSLDKYVSHEKIEDFKCENCKKSVTVIKRNSIAELPNVLIVHLQRILFDYDSLQNNKINSRLEFPYNLNMKSYTTEVLSNNDIKMNKSSTVDSSSFITYEKEDVYYEYNLVGIVVHKGSADAGHYYSYINVKREGSLNEIQFNKATKKDIYNWLEFNDSNIYPFDLKNVEEECFGGCDGLVEEKIHWLDRPSDEKEKGKSAYMLFYERKKKKPIKILMEKECVLKDQISYIEVDRPNKFEIEKQYDLFNSDSEASFKKDILQTVFLDKEKGEFYHYQGFYNIKKLVPKRDFEEVYIDNMSFLNDQKVFNIYFNDFFNRTFLSLKNSVKEKKFNENDYRMTINIFINYLFKVFPKSSFKQVLSK